MITRVLILECDYCPRSTRVKGAEVTESALVERAVSRGWKRTPDPKFPRTSPIDRCPKCADAVRVMTWWRCPNEPRCPHGAVVHDVYDFDDPSPTCCVDGCACGRRSDLAVRAALNQHTEKETP